MNRPAGKRTAVMTMAVHTPLYANVVVDLVGVDYAMTGTVARVLDAMAAADLPPLAIRSYRRQAAAAASFSELMRLTFATVSVRLPESGAA